MGTISSVYAIKGKLVVSGLELWPSGPAPKNFGAGLGEGRTAFF